MSADDAVLPKDISKLNDIMVWIEKKGRPVPKGVFRKWAGAQS